MYKSKTTRLQLHYSFMQLKLESLVIAGLFFIWDLMLQITLYLRFDASDYSSFEIWCFGLFVIWDLMQATLVHVV